MNAVLMEPELCLSWLSWRAVLLYHAAAKFVLYTKAFLLFRCGQKLKVLCVIRGQIRDGREDQEPV
jgi:hypothetical protein